MALLARKELLDKFKKELSEWTSNHPMDTTHIQMASLDEMMAAYGYVPRRVFNYPAVKDGRFGYEKAFRSKKSHTLRPAYISLEDAVRLHNGHFELYSKKYLQKVKDMIEFAHSVRIVETVSIQREKGRGCGNGIKSQTRWIKFLEE